MKYLVLASLLAATPLTDGDGCGGSVEVDGIENLIREKASLSGIVTEFMTHRPLSVPATIRIEDQVTTTDQYGFFYIDELTVGNQILVISAQGYNTITPVLTLEPGANVAGELRLERSYY